MPLEGDGIALIGTGAWGGNHMRVWRALGALRAVSDVNEERLRSLRVELPDDVSAYIDWQEAIGRKDVRGVVVATPAVTHSEIALRCLEAGKDVLVEKPLATSLAEAEKLVAIAMENSSVLMVGHVLEYHPAVLALRSLVSQGKLGKILYLYSNRLNFGRVRTEENALWSFAPHDIALILRLVGAMPTVVAARGGDYLNRGVADSTLMSLDFPGSISAHVFVSWLHPFKEHRFVVVGDQQMAVFDDTAPWSEKLQLFPHRLDWVEGKVPIAHRAEAIPVELQPTEPLEEECRSFLQAIETRTTPLTDGPSGVRVLEVLEVAQRSLERSGAPLPLAGADRLPINVHASSIVEDRATVGEGTRIWHFSHVMPGAAIGRACTLGQNVFIGGGARVGDRVKIQNNVSVYDGVVLEDDVFCGPSVTFTNVSNPRSEIDRKSEFQTTLVRQGATIGANATVVCGTTIGRYALVGAGAVVTHDVRDHALVVGVPARQVGWACTCGARVFIVESRGRCAVCHREYVEGTAGLASEER